MTMKNDTKSEERLTCHFKIDMRSFKNFDSNAPNLNNLLFN